MLTLLNEIKNQKMEWESEIKPRISKSLKTVRTVSRTLKNIILDSGLIKPWKSCSDITLLLAVFDQNLPPQDQAIEYFTQILPLLNEIIQAIHYDLIMVNMIYSKFRKKVFNKYGQTRDTDQYRYIRNTKIFGLTPDQVVRVKKQAEVRLSLNNSNLQKFKARDIFRIIKLASQGNYLDLILTVALCTGSRLCEILKVSDFIALDDPKMIKVIGLAKDRRVSSGEVQKSEKIVIKPLIMIDSANIIRMVAEIRRNVPQDKTVEKTTQFVSARVNALVRYRFNRDDIKFHTTRKIYGSLAHMISPMGQGKSLTQFLSTVLGHEGLISACALNYSTVDIELEKMKTDPDLIEKLSQLEIDNAELKSQMTELMKNMRNLKTKVKLKNQKNEQVKLERIPNRGGARVRFDLAVGLLRVNNIDINSRNLRALGIGSGTVLKFSV
tara:strand:+ start:1815 stop:3131 length:1317 start_codon:yes stop_codon:yes gene_type:complete